MAILTISNPTLHIINIVFATAIVLVSSSPQTVPLISDSNTETFTVNLSVGTSPPKNFYATFSTENDLTVAPCGSKPPSSRDIPCHSRICQSFSERTCKGNSNQCFFTVTHGDGSTDSGAIERETIAFSSTTLSSSVVLGCGGQHSEAVAGFGGGPLSLPAQLKQTKFAYCLSSKNQGSLSLGLVDNRGVKFMLVRDNQKPAFLYASLRSMKVGNIPINMMESKILLATSTPLTKLPRMPYELLKKAVITYIGKKPFSFQGGVLDTCYRVEGKTVLSKFPDVILESGNSNSVVVPKENAFGFVEAGTYCLMASVATGDAILGSLWQNNFVVGVDTQANTVSFRNTTGACK